MSSPSPKPARVPSAVRTRWWESRAVLSSALLGLAFVAAWILPAGVTLGAGHTDLIGQFVPWRSFAADSLRQGDLPLWNPYTFSGQPFLGGFQSAVYYPPNLAFLALPLSRAMTFIILAHLIVLAWGVGYWCDRRGFHPAVGWCAGWVFAGSGVVFPHVYAGHLSNLCTMAWAPWLFAGLERWWRHREPGGVLLAVAAVALQILSGQVQYVYFTACAAGLHAVAALIAEPGTRWRAARGLLLAYVLGAALAAAQLLPGLAATAEGIRQGKLDYAFASSFALPPENLLTALVPGWLGVTDRGGVTYWGRGYWWEMSVYAGGVLWLFVVAALWSPEFRRWRVAELSVAVVLLACALGRHLPLYDALYRYVPGIGQFRGMSKFAFPALLFVTMVAAAGLDTLVRATTRPVWLARMAFIVAGVLVIAAVVLRTNTALVNGWHARMSAVAHLELIHPVALPDSAAANASRGAVMAAAAFLAVGLALASGRWWSRLRWVPAAVLLIEVGAFAWSRSAVTPLTPAMPEELKNFVAAHPGDYRVLNLLRPNGGYLLGAPDLWGNDPGVLKRYAEFITWTQGGDPNRASQNVAFREIPPLYAMLRCRYAFVATANGADVRDVPNPMPRVQLIRDYRVASGRDAVFAALTSTGFDPRKQVILEKEPVVPPTGGGEGGSVRVLKQTADELLIHVEVPAATLLLVTDPYSRDWRATAEGASAQHEYDVMPANYVLMAIPVKAGRHEIRLAYSPRSVPIGIGVSLVALLGFIGASLYLSRREKHHTP